MGSLGEKETTSCPTGPPRGRHSFSRIVLGGEPVEGGRVECVFNIVAAISTLACSIYKALLT